MKPVFIDLFAGCGGLSLGLGRAGFSTLFAVENHRDAFATYQANLLDKNMTDHQWPSWLAQREWCVRDVLEQHGNELRGLRGKVDLVAGGPPCQGFSLNGLRNPEDPRSRLVEIYLNYMEIIQPRMILLENVKGFQSMPYKTGGTYAQYVSNRLESLGYNCWSRIIIASEWGVPQKRHRFILIAIRKSAPVCDPFELLYERRHEFLEKRSLAVTGTTASDALSDLETGHEPKQGPGSESTGYRYLHRNEQALTPYQQLMRKDCESQPADMRLPRHSQARISQMQKIMDTCQRGTNIKPEDRQRLGIKKRTITPISPDKPAPTVTTAPDDAIHYAEPRTLTVREQARLQSFPDWFAFHGSYTSGGIRRRSSCPRHTQVGNAVPPLLAEAIGEVLRELAMK